MEFKTTKYLPRFKEELPPINKPTHSTSSKIIKVKINIYIDKCNCKISYRVIHLMRKTYYLQSIDFFQKKCQFF